MFNSTVLEVAIGMAFVYLLLSLFCSAVNEVIASILHSRAKNLEQGINSLFTEGLKTEEVKGDKPAPALTLSDAIYQHGLVQSLYRSGAGIAQNVLAKDIKTLPSYIPSRTFASALLDIVFPGDKANPTGLPADLPAMLTKLKSLPEGKGKEAITTLVVQAQGDIDKTRAAFEEWYDDGMDRAAGWYKRQTQFTLFFIGLTAALLINVDSISVATKLWASPALRTYAIAAATDYEKAHATADASSTSTPPASTATPTIDDSTRKAQDSLASLQSLGLPVGWDGNAYSWWHGWSANSLHSWQGLGLAIVGWLLTAIAMTLGAPFWFDLLNQFMVVRSTIKPREKSDVEKSKDATAK